MIREIGYVNVEEAGRSRQFSVKDWIWVRLGRVVVWDVAMEDVRKNEGGGAIANDDSVDSGRN